MRNNLFFVFVFFILVVSPFVLAIELNIQTLPNHRISAFFREPDKLTNIDSVHMDTGSGDVVINSSLFGGDQLDLVLTLKKDGESVLNREFRELSTNQPIYINFLPGLSKDEMLMDLSKKEVKERNPVVPENATKEKAEVIEDKKEEIQEKKIDSAVTGKSVEDNEKIIDSKIIYYVLGFIVGLSLIFFIIQTYRKKMKSSDNYKIVKYSRNDDKRIADAERKLAEAKMELDEIKGREKKLIEAKERFQKDRNELKKLGAEGFY